jgi:hypothetical protein
MTTATFRLHVDLPADPAAARERRALLGQAIAVLEEALRGASAEEGVTFADQLVRALRPPAPAPALEDRAWLRQQVAAEGGTADPAELAGRVARNLRRAREQRERLLAGSLTAPQVADLLGVSRQTPHDWRRARRLLAAFDRGAWRFPAWQFDPAAPDGVLAGLPAVLAELDGLDDLGRIAWFVAPRPGLDGRSVVDLLRAGDYQLALQLARSAAVT